MGKDVTVVAVGPIELKFSVPTFTKKRKGGPATYDANNRFWAAKWRHFSSSLPTAL